MGQPDFIPAEDTPDFIPAEESKPEAPTSHVAAKPSGAGQWLTDLESDLRYGGGQTIVGRGLKAIGYQGAQSGAQPGVGKMLVSPATGPTYAAHGIATGHPGEVLSGIGEAAEIPMAFAAPETAEAAAPIGAKLGRTAIQTGKTAAKIGDVASFERASKILNAVKSGGQAIGGIWKKAPEAIAPELNEAEGLPEVEAAQPQATAHLHNAIGKEPTPQNLASIPTRTTPQADSLGSIPVHDEAQGLPEVAAHRPQAEAYLRSVTQKPIPTATAPSKAIGPTLQEQLEQSLNAIKLNPKVPLRAQIPATKGIQTDMMPEGHTSVESSALRSYRYDPQAREFHARATSGDTTYVYGDVSPEEARSFEQSESKGKAWQQLRSRPLVAKIVNGKRLAVRPTAK